MCGRFSLTVNELELNLRFETEGGTTPYISRYNCAPTQMLAVISNLNPKVISYFKWGLIPSWAKDPSIGNKMINARAETIHEKPSYKSPLRNKRCLIPADSFYEWKQNGQKTPFRISLVHQKIFSMAGLWDEWISSDGTIIQSFSIITVSANSFMKPIHDRMPVILHSADENLWLQSTDEKEVISLLKPYESELMDAYQISGLINSPRNDSADIILKAENHSPLIPGDLFSGNQQ